MFDRVLKVGFWLFFAGWFVSYTGYHRPENFLWTCNVAFIVTAVALLVQQRRLVFSVCLILVAVADFLWALDVAGRLLTGTHWLGGTAYMFNPEIPAAVRFFSLEHLFLTPVLIYWLHPVGYDRRALPVCLLAVPLIYYATYLLGEPASEVNWVWGFYGQQQSWMAPVIYPGVAASVFFLVFVVPAHFLARRLLHLRGAPDVSGNA